MIKIKSVFIYLGLILLIPIAIINCSDENTVDPIPIDTSDFRFPFADGNSWTYTRTISVFDIRPDSILHYFTDYPIVITGTATILYDTTINSVVTKCFADEFVVNNANQSNRYYYINNDTSFILFARRQSGPATGLFPLKVSEKIFIESDNSSGKSELTILQDSLRSTLKYPIITGREWINYFNFGLFATIKYVGFENMYIQSHTISCMKTKIEYSALPEYPIYDYYSKYGMIKRFWFVDDITFSTVTNPNGIGLIDQTDETGVTSFNIQ